MHLIFDIVLELQIEYQQKHMHIIIKSLLVGPIICNGCNKVHDHKICVFYRFDNTKRSCMDDGITKTNENNTNIA